jgi:hypothetical protein
MDFVEGKERWEAIHFVRKCIQKIVLPEGSSTIMTILLGEQREMLKHCRVSCEYLRY